jgi:hypothetical protein
MFVRGAEGLNKEKQGLIPGVDRGFCICHFVHIGIGTPSTGGSTFEDTGIGNFN